MALETLGIPQRPGEPSEADVSNAIREGGYFPGPSLRCVPPLANTYRVRPPEPDAFPNNR